MSECAGADSCGCEVRFEGLTRDYKARLWAVIALNASMFAVEMSGGVMAGSQALQADALDFLGDTLTYGMSLAVIGLHCGSAPQRHWLRRRRSRGWAFGCSAQLCGTHLFSARHAPR